MFGADSPRLIDSHCHLQSLEAAACERTLDEAREAGVRGFLVPAITLHDCERLFELCDRHADVWCAIGVHPHHAESWKADDGARLQELVDDPRVVAVGECGLDFHYRYSPPEVQVSAMRNQWEIALDAGLPVVVHSRDCDQEMLQALRAHTSDGLRGVFHSFAGGEVLARDLFGRGFSLGFSGMITFSGAGNVRRALLQTPHQRLLVETDTPYLAPVPYRGRENQPSYLVEVVRAVADQLQLSQQQVGELTSRNFFDLFRRARPAPASTP